MPLDGPFNPTTQWLSRLLERPGSGPFGPRVSTPPFAPASTFRTNNSVFENAGPPSLFQQHVAQSQDGPVSSLNDGPPTTETVIAIDVPLVLTEEGAIKTAYQTFAESQGFSRAAARDYSERAFALTNGRAYRPSSNPDQDGIALTRANLRQQRDSGRIEIGLTRAQLGLLHGMSAQQADHQSPITGQLGAPGMGTLFFPRAANVVPGQGTVSGEIAVKILENMADGRPPFRPELGKAGQVSWFVTEGSPYTGRAPANPVTIPVEIGNPTGAPVLEFNEAQLLEIFEAEQRSAFRTAESQYRAAKGIPADQTLSNTALRRINRNAAAMAESQMWIRVGERVAASESGIGRVNLRNSMFSRSGDGQFTLTNRASAVRVQGGATALIDVLRRSGEPVERSVVQAAEQLATKNRWAGRVQGVFKVGGRVMIVVGAVADGYRIYTADDQLKATAEVAGGWAGATAAGGAFATWAAPVNATGPWGWLAYGAGTLTAGAVGYFAGEAVASEVYELVVDGDPIFIGPQDQ